MRLAAVIHRYRGALEARHGARLLPSHYRALDALATCRSAEAGQVLWGCGDCQRSHTTPRSCGHRSCPRRQNHQTTDWLERQRAKLLPVDYFMVTFTLPAGLPDQSVVHCKRVGRGAPALDYLARYLYRGVLGEANIIDDRNAQVTFRYTDGRTGEAKTRTLAGEDFLLLVLQHVLPRRFRRVRDHGFLLGNARRVLTLVQRVLCVRLPTPATRKRPVIACPECRAPMHVIAVYTRRAQPG